MAGMHATPPSTLSPSAASPSDASFESEPIAITQLEAAINFWRERHPATGEESRLCAEAAALAAPYALMIIDGVRSIAMDALSAEARAAFAAWRHGRDVRPDPAAV